MRQMGVRPIEGKDKGKKKGKAKPGRRGSDTRKPAAKPAAARPAAAKPAAAKPAAAKPAAAKPAAAKPAAAKPASAKPARKPVPPAPAARQRPRAGGSAHGDDDTRSLLAEIDRLRAQLEQQDAVDQRAASLSTKVQALRADLDAARAQAADAVQALETSQAALAKADAGRESAEAALQRATAPGGDGAVSVAALLRERGVLGETEVEQMLRGMVDQHLTGELLSLLSTVRPDQLSALLARRLLLLGGCAACPQLSGRVALSVPKARCEICGGVELAEARRRFYDACLINGLTSVVLVGGAPGEQRVLQELLSDRRVALTLVHGGLRKSAEDVAHDLERVRAVVIWQGPALLPQAAAPYETFTGPVVRVEAPDLAHMLVAAAAALNQVEL